MPVAHVGHWIGQVLALIPFVLVLLLLAISWWRHRDDPHWYEREAEEEAERRLDEILKEP